MRFRRTGKGFGFVFIFGILGGPQKGEKGKGMKKKLRYFQILAAGALSWLVIAPLGAQQSQAVGLRMDVDKRQVEVGEHLTLTIEFKQLGSGNSTATGEPSISTPEHFEIQGQSSATQVTIINQQTAVISTTRLNLVATKAGDETLGPALLVFLDPQGKKREIKSNVITVTVVEKSGFSLFGKKKNENPPNQNPTVANPPAAANDDELRDVKPLLPEAFNALRLAFWSLVLLLIAGFIWWRFRKRGGAQKPPPIPLGKAEQLRSNWKKLSNEDLSSKEFCLALSSLVRECLQYKYSYPAVNYTTEEILKAMEKQKASDDERVAVEKCLKTCDRVLHADGNLTGRDNLRALCSALLPKLSKS
jgi:hypothetical protein